MGGRGRHPHGEPVLGGRTRRGAVLALTLAASGLPLAGQSPAELIAEVQRVAGSAPDSAESLLRTALHRSTLRAESVNVWVWIGITQFLRGRDSVTREAFRHAVALQPELQVRNLDNVSPRLAQILADERERAAALATVYPSSGLDEPPRVVDGPPLEYPLDLWRRRVSGTVVVTAIVDTGGRAERPSVEVLEASDPGFREPARRMIEAYRFTPGRLRGRTVRAMIRMRVPLTPPPIYATPLVDRARAVLAAGHADTAVMLTDLALDSTARATEGDRAYALIVRSMAHKRAGHDGLASADSAAGVALYRDLSRRGVDLAPFFRRLADSVSGRGRATSGLGPPTAVNAPERIVLVSYPPVRYPPEMRTLRVDGTVIVEVTVDTAGRVEPGSVRVVRSPNPGLDAEARRVVTGAVYRPVTRNGRKVRLTIRQPVRFELY